MGLQPELLRRLKRVVEAFDPDVVQVNGARTVKYGAFLSGFLERRRYPVIYRNIGSSRDWVLGVRRRLFYRAVLRRLDAVAAISHESLATLEPMLSARTRSVVISNAIDENRQTSNMTRTQMRSSIGTPAGAPLILYVGSFSREKRVDLLIRAFASAKQRVPDLHLWLVGDGALRKELEQLVQQRDLTTAVRFLGVQEHVAAYYGAADVLALASDTEGVPAVVLEAGYAGLPVIATHVGGLPECVAHERTGLLVASGDESGLADALVRLGSDADLRRTMGSQAAAMVRSKHLMNLVASQYIDLYRTVCKSTRA